MAAIRGSRLLARALKDQGVEVIFFLTGGPMVPSELACQAAGIKLIDVHHEQAAAMMAHAYARVTGWPGVCIGAAGPGVTNLATGVATAFQDAAPLVVLGGASAQAQTRMEAFQEIDQVSMMRPITKWAERVIHPSRIPELVEMAFRQATQGRPAPVYLEFPGDVIYGRTEEEGVYFPPHYPEPVRPLANTELVSRAVALLGKAERPVLISGSGVFWSGASKELQELVEVTGLPFFASPQGRGAVPDDHPLSFPAARNCAFSEADLLLVVGTRFSSLLSFGRPPRFSARARVIQVDIDGQYIGQNRPVEVGLVGDARMVLRQLVGEIREQGLKGWGESPWVERLREADARRRAEMEPLLNSNQVPIHPARLCREVRDVLKRDAILAVDGNVTLHLGRQLIPTHHPAHRLNCGLFGCIGVGVPFGIGAKVAKPDKQAVVLTGDGGFGLNGMEMHTAVKHKLPVVVVVNNNQSWDALVKRPEVPGQYIGPVRYDLMVSALGGYGELVEKPEDLRPALERAFASGLPACLNVFTDPYAAATTISYSGYD